MPDQELFTTFGAFYQTHTHIHATIIRMERVGRRRAVSTATKVVYKMPGLAVVLVCCFACLKRMHLHTHAHAAL